MSHPALSQLAQVLEDRAEELTQRRVVAGFDGFVDEMISVVGERQDLEAFTAVPRISDFASWAQQAAGRSSLKEIVVHRRDAGGCAVNLGDGLLALGCQLDLFATLGNPIQAPFQDLVDRCRLVESWCTLPGRTLAFEFNDGKLMFPSVSQLAELDVAYVQEAIAQGQYQQSCAEADLIAFTDWTLYPHMTAVWKEIQEEVLGNCSQQPWVFIDLVDPRARSRADILAMLQVLPGFQTQARCVLGLNLNEANAVADHLGLALVEEVAEDMSAQAAAIRQALGIEQVVIHAVQYAAAASETAALAAEGPYCAQPKRSVGAGDRFNAGYCAGLLLGQGLQECLLLGNASSGFFVRQARSASPLELSLFCRRWQQGALDP